MSQILFFSSQRTYSFTEIQRSQAPSFVTAYESVAWQFCHEWLLGKETFTLHTSGSTGAPKPIVLSCKQMIASALMTGKALRLNPNDTALVNLNVQYIAGVMMLVRGMELGLSFTLMEPSSNPLAAFSEGTSFDFQSYVPLQLQTIVEQTPEKIAILNSAKAILVGGAPVSHMLEDALHQLTAPIYQTYAMTETVSHVALRRLNGTERQGFYVALDTIFFETDPRNCLIIHAPQVATHAVLTNDVVELLSPTTFRWLGRADHVINSGGVKVQAEKIESVVEAIFSEEAIPHRFFVTGLPHPKLGEAVTLVIEGKLFSEQLENSIFQKLKTALSRYELPKQIRYVDRFVETPTAKIDRNKTISLLQ